MVNALGGLNPISRITSLWQIGLCHINQLCYQRLPLTPLRYLPRGNLPTAYASLKKQEAISNRIEFAKVNVF
jgi:hypothetical protein